MMRYTAVNLIAIAIALVGGAVVVLPVYIGPGRPGLNLWIVRV